MRAHSFEIDVSFTGICAFFQSKNDPNTVCVVMPGGIDYHQALDEELLCKHQSILEGPNNLYVNLENTRAEFKLTFDGSAANTQTPVQLPVDVIDLREVSRNLTFDPRIVDDNPPRIVNSQVVLHYGSFKSDATHDHWDVDDYEGGHPVTNKFLTHSVIWTVSNLKSAQLLLSPYTGIDQTIDLKPPAKTNNDNNTYTIPICIENTCKDVPGGRGNSDARRDRDFKWYFELLDKDSRNSIRKYLYNNRGLDLPIPHFHPPQAEAVTSSYGGADCYTAQGGTLDF